ncbi:unnamed protein product [Arabidopsis lyrata]|uniref:Predicted protein n=1 Tax=Arabidopsis lyrata subsp. lyrata TaxID=81972 RepID=D7MC78_ARALL|nr:predicted protein [Arabidopsis lyrata subsp. lyrata]CAH8274842.1 unnamed protein product [Arabidopsis lyrata]
MKVDMKNEMYKMKMRMKYEKKKKKMKKEKRKRMKAIENERKKMNIRNEIEKKKLKMKMKQEKRKMKRRVGFEKSTTIMDLPDEILRRIPEPQDLWSMTRATKHWNSLFKSMTNPYSGLDTSDLLDYKFLSNKNMTRISSVFCFSLKLKN